MTILAYWPGRLRPARCERHALRPGRGRPRYGFPAALGAATADPTRPVLAVSGDGGALYSIAELATARQYDLNVTWLIVDDGGYGILREYMTGHLRPVHGDGADAPGLRGPRGVLRGAGVRTTPETLETDWRRPCGAGPSWCCSGGTAHVRADAPD